MKNLFEYLVSAILATLLIVTLYANLKAQLIDVITTALAPFAR